MFLFVGAEIMGCATSQPAKFVDVDAQQLPVVSGDALQRKQYDHVVLAVLFMVMFNQHT